MEQQQRLGAWWGQASQPGPWRPRGHRLASCECSMPLLLGLFKTDLSTVLVYAEDGQVQGFLAKRPGEAQENWPQCAQASGARSPGGARRNAPALCFDRKLLIQRSWRLFLGFQLSCLPQTAADPLGAPAPPQNYTLGSGQPRWAERLRGRRASHWRGWILCLGQGLLLGTGPPALHRHPPPSGGRNVGATGRELAVPWPLGALLRPLWDRPRDNEIHG